MTIKVLATAFRFDTHSSLGIREDVVRQKFNQDHDERALRAQ